MALGFPVRIQDVQLHQPDYGGGFPQSGYVRQTAGRSADRIPRRAAADQADVDESVLAGTAASQSRRCRRCVSKTSASTYRKMPGKAEMAILPSDKAIAARGPDRPVANWVTRNCAGSKALELSISGFAREGRQKPSSRAKNRI